MPFNSVTLALFAPLALAFMLWLLRRWQMWPALAGAAATLLLSFAFFGILPLPGEEEAVWLALGRVLRLGQEAQQGLALAYLTLAALLAAAAFWPQGRDFAPLSVAFLSPLALALLVDPPVFGAVALLIAAALLAGVIQAGRPGPTHAALRFLLMVLLAAPLLLTAGWLLENNPAPYTLGIARITAVAFLALLAGFPFHIWITPLLADSPPLAIVVAAGLFPLGALLFAIHFLAEYPWLQQNIVLSQLLRWGGILTLLTAALLAYHAALLSRLLAYLILIDGGMVILTFSLMAPDSFAASLAMLTLRLISLLAAGAGLILLRAHSEEETLEGLAGLAWRAPIGGVLFVYGALSLIGLPLTPGFSGRWSATTLLAQAGAPELIFIFLLAAASGLVGLLRAALTLARSNS